MKKALSSWSKATYGDIFHKLASLEEVVMVHVAQFELNPFYSKYGEASKGAVEWIKYLALEEELWK